MEKFEGLTLEAVQAKESELKSEGYAEAQTIVAVEPGLLDGNPVIIAKNKVKTPDFFIITYTRNKESRYFKGCNFNAKHLTNGKQYDNLKVGMTDEDMERVAQPANLSKSYSLRAERYKTSDQREVTTVKLAS